ncbi:hypothetical protein [Brasilonema sennae]|uniref:hypothetical protein n=1 Tax=Brasilonema sennae TaxID=1397703 RepID=UPI00155AA496|nr:hypothetical protein [Brasilonema sennae]
MPWEPDSQSPRRSKLVAWVASPDRLWGNPNALRVRQSPRSGDPPAALVSPGPSVGKPSSRTGSLRERPSPTAGNPLGLRSAPYACGTATPIGASCHNALNPRKAQLLAALDSPQGAALGTEVAHEGNPTKSAGLTRCLGRETLIKHWSHQIKPDSYNS